MQWREFLEKLQKDDNNVIIVEGVPPATRRKGILQALETAQPGDWILLGNANRPEYYRERALLKARAATVKMFDFNEGGSKFRVVEFYKMPGKPKRRSKDGEDDLSR